MYDVLLLWIKIFEILRVNSKTAFFVRLIVETVKDMSSFFFMFLGSIFMFTTAIYVLDFNGIQRGDGNHLINFTTELNNYRSMNTFYN